MIESSSAQATKSAAEQAKFLAHTDLEEIWPTQRPELLQALHLLTRDGKLNQDARRKLKQIYHFLRLLLPPLIQITGDEGDVDSTSGAREAARNGISNVATREGSTSGAHEAARHTPHIVDVGAGKGYLGFLIYDLWLKVIGRGFLTSIEIRPELVTAAKALSSSMGFTRMGFFSGDISDFPASGLSSQTATPNTTGGGETSRSTTSNTTRGGETSRNTFSSIASSETPFQSIDLVTALHACDTATDEAIALGIRADAKAIAVVPCCQAEVARLLTKVKLPDPGLWQLWRHPMHAREFGSHLTNVIRGLVLESAGYKVTVTELAGWEHSLKNELILAVKPPQETTETKLVVSSARERLAALLAEIPVEPALIKLNPSRV